MIFCDVCMDLGKLGTGAKMVCRLARAESRSVENANADSSLQRYYDRMQCVQGTASRPYLAGRR